MTKLTESQLAEIAERLGDRSGPTPSTMYQEPTFSESEVRRLLNHIAAVAAELAAANQRAADAARVERAAVVKWLKQRAREFDAALETAQMTPNAYAALHTERAVLIIAADAISRNEHNQDAATRQE